MTELLQLKLRCEVSVYSVCLEECLGMILHVVASFKYLGHYITDDLSDDDDINRQRRTLFVRGNIILRKFNMCSLGVKLTLFRTYCSPMLYSTTLVELQKSTITILQIAYHNIFLMFLGMSKYESSSYLCTYFLTFNVANL